MAKKSVVQPAAAPTTSEEEEAMANAPREKVKPQVEKEKVVDTRKNSEMTESEKKKIKQANKAKANPEKSDAKKEKSDAKRERRKESGSTKTFS